MQISAVFVALAALPIASFPKVDSTTLGPGSPAPKLEVKSWIKGEPVRALKGGQTYVVEFWATWCGPCMETIPHLTELAKKHVDVKFIGISIWEDNDDKHVQDFVAKMGDKMGYAVGYSGNQTGMAKSWMDAAKQTGIPASFIVKDNLIQWVGHPLQVEKQLILIAENKFDVKAARVKYDNLIARQEAARKLEAEVLLIEKQYDSGDKSGAKARLDQVEQSPEGKSVGASLRFKWLANDDVPAWKELCKKRMEVSADERSELARFAEPNALLLSEQCKWLISELTSDRFPPDWYPFLCGARMFRQLKEYDKALAHCARSRQIILDYRKANPDVPKGNALEVLQELVDKIEKDKRG